MLKNTLLLTLISILFFSCTIKGNYYLINSSSKKIKVSLELNAYQLLMEKKVQLKSKKHEKKNVRYAAYKKMKPLSFSVDSLTSIVYFDLPSKHVVYLGSSNNAREIGKIKILDNGQTQLIDPNQRKFKTKGFMKYVVMYRYE